MRKNILIILITTFVLLLINIQGASSFSLNTANPYLDAFKIEFNPPYPGANTKVEAKIISYSFDADASYTTWKLNGEIIEQGRGKKTAEFKTGDIGSSISLYVYITTEKNQEVEKSVGFTIGEIDLLWQASTYTPPFYKGKAEPIAGSLIKITALPHGLGSAKNLVYDWQRNYKNQTDASGVGKNVFSFVFSEIYSEEKIKVQVWGPKKDYSIEKSIHIRAGKPEIIFYKENPLEGPVFQRAFVEEVNLIEPDLVIRGEPYFFPKADIDLLFYNWTMNKNPIESLFKPNIIGLTVPTETSGQTIIQLEIKDAQKYFQKAINSIKINF